MELNTAIKLYQLFGVCLMMTSLVVALQFEDCGSEGAKVNAVNLSPCNSDPCILYPDHTYRINITFTPYEDTTKANALVEADILGSSYDNPEGNACRFMKCPVKKGVQESLVGRVAIKSSFPRTKFQAKWIVFDDREKKLFCIGLHLEVQDERNTLKPNSLSNVLMSFSRNPVDKVELVHIQHVLEIF